MRLDRHECLRYELLIFRERTHSSLLAGSVPVEGEDDLPLHLIVVHQQASQHLDVIGSESGAARRDGMVTTRGAILRTMLFVNLMGIPVATVNWLIGSNYMYLCTKPGVDSPFLVGDWPWYLLGLEVVALLLMAIASVPMLYLRRKEQAGQILNSKNQKSNSEFV